jgi:putative transposase
MKKSRYTDEQIAYALRQGETGTRVEEICRQMGISDATYYNWKRSLADWDQARSASSSSWKKRTRSSNRWSPI